MKNLLLVASLTFLAPIALVSCSGNETAEVETPTESETIASSGEKGNLVLVANGEDFVRQGFVTKDGWQINFDNVYVTLADVQAYQTEPPFDPDTAEEIKASESVVLISEPITIDLAEGDADAQPITVAEKEAPAGNYNALSWQVVPGETDVTAGKTIVLDGTATKDGETVDFVIGFNQPLTYQCGEFVGDDRKGILKGTETADVETTFHFDHIFGDADAPADDPLNQEAVGFQPMAALATNGTLEVDQETLQSELSSEDYQKLENAIASLGHVGEGHCK
ncbi:DUF4382 domain-containing protein [Oscillatoria salina]|uniref:DUF4382 domain-containing protein n=1 Tax=Oscillatoria salina TaxID=331517 RepID=UPI0013BD355A|nr:DUF4382 domain-containing protein [Oscillatoria salina]MBZ8180093.1 DUF4382 domain-containing protein [Oscillatoria salina IIICB1]NET89312.1 DUF4382 domain-containing protein [Kamptonema sp. SIO1D9]